uniref:Platelet-activating factor acetylhydrolase plasma/intracellular isoform II n=1 Tax=uncultured bacterium 5E7 TaxID=1701324 RepID=A0A0N7F2A7_9BACT|nr:platelet-activating factor acetylhydrolase plasma/intracellular isoform II [uncultured bacterium 5E7]
MRGLLVLLLLPLVLAAAPPAWAQQPPPDPAGPGLYGVGLTSRTFQRTSSVSGQRNLETTIWYPAGSPSDGSPAIDAPPNRAGAPYPVITWSHGWTGSPMAYRYFLTHLASFGFVVLAPFHRGLSVPGPSCRAPCTDQDGTPATWQVDRPGDLTSVLAQALSLSASGDPLLGGLLDPARVGGGGHSFGGWTTLMLMAASHPYRAVVAMAPGAPGKLTASLPPAMASASEPAMLMAASLDSGLPLTFQQGLYARIPTPPEHWLLTLQRAGHLSFADTCRASGLIGISCDQAMPQDQAHTLIDRWATAFLLQWVAGDARYGPVLDGLRAAGDPALQVAVSGR